MALMSSNTNNFSNLTCIEDDLEPRSYRNAVSTIKKPKSSQVRRKFIPLKPLKLDKIRKAIDEADECRLNYVTFPQDEEDKEKNKENKALQDSFDFNFAPLIENTPIRHTKPETLAITEPKVHFNLIHIKSVTYIILNELGKGGSSKVLSCFEPLSKTHYAVKVVSLHNQQCEFFIHEVHMLEMLQKCDRIIKMFDYEIKENKLYMVLEVGGTDLSKILKKLAVNSAHLPLYMLISYWMQMLHAVKQIHSHGIIHADLKPANFLMVDGVLKLIDFGIARSMQGDMTSVIKNVAEGSFNYISPEAVCTDSTSNNVDSPSFGKPKYKISCKSDVWSLGCILYQMVYRKTPFQHITQMWPKLSAIANPNYQIDFPQVGWVSEKIINTMKNCLQWNMKLRPSIDDLIADYENMLQMQV